MLKDGGGFPLNLLLEAPEPMATFACLEGKRMEFNINFRACNRNRSRNNRHRHRNDHRIISITNIKHIKHIINTS